MDDVQAVADLMRSRNSQGGRLRDLLQVITGDSTREGSTTRALDGDPDDAQCPVAGRTQGAFDSFGQAVVFQALRRSGTVASGASFSSLGCSPVGRIRGVADWTMDGTPYSFDKKPG